MSNWDKCLIGSILSDPSVMQEADGLVPSDFTGTSQIVWGEMLALHNRSALGVRSLVEALRDNPDFARTSDARRPEDFINEAITYRGAEVQEYVRQITSESTRRQVTLSAALIAGMAKDEGVDTEELLDFSEKKILALRRNQTDNGVTLSDLMGVYLPRLDAIRAGTFVPAWTPKCQAIRSIIQFCEGADYMIVAARPAEGKSSLLRYEALASAHQGNPVAIFNLENDPMEYARNFLSLETHIDSDRMKEARLLTDEELEHIKQAAQTLARLPLKIYNVPGQSIGQILRIARKDAAENHTKLVMLDYVQLVSNGIESKVQDVSMTSQQYRAFSLSMGIPVIAASQLSRDIEKRGAGSKPQLSDLRDSGCLSGETLVTLSNGSRTSIKDLVGQEVEVLSLNEATMKIEPAIARNVWKTGTKEVFKMTTSLGQEIRATANHQFLTLDGWKRLDELCPGDFIALPRVVHSKTYGSMKTEEAALLGHLIGDGCTLPNHVMQYTTVEQELAEIVAGLAKQLFEVSPRINRERNWLQVYLPSPNMGGGRRNPIAVWLDGMGVFGLRSWEKKVPDIVFMQNDEIISTFLRHLWSTDGSVQLVGGKKPRPIAYYASSSEQLARDVQFLLLRLGIMANVVKASAKCRGIWNVIVTGKQNLITFAEKIGAIGVKRIDLEKIVEYLQNRNHVPNRDVIPASVWIKIKARMSELGLTYREFFARMGWKYSGTTRYKFNIGRLQLEKIADALSNDYLKRLASSEVAWDKIISIDPDGIEDVYDAEVTNHHNFIAGGMIVHNSIEQDATIVVFPRSTWTDPTPDQLRNFPENVDPRTNQVLQRPKAIPIKFYVQKNRNGSTGESDMVKWVKSTGDYQTLERAR